MFGTFQCLQNDEVLLVSDKFESEQLIVLDEVDDKDDDRAIPKTMNGVHFTNPSFKQPPMKLIPTNAT